MRRARNSKRARVRDNCEIFVMSVRSIDAVSLGASADVSVGSDVGTANSRPVTASGFRHFLDTPLASQRFRAFGIDPLQSPACLPRIRALMNRLSRRLDAEIRWPQHQNLAQLLQGIDLDFDLDEMADIGPHSLDGGLDAARDRDVIVFDQHGIVEAEPMRMVRFGRG